MREIYFPKKGGTAKSFRFLVLSHDVFIVRRDEEFFIFILVFHVMNHNNVLLEKMKTGDHPIVYINACTHGNEKVGARILEAIEKISAKKGMIVTNIANREAFALDKRFIDQDLNRSFPGKLDGNHEERLACELLPLVQAADIVIDIHSTTSGRLSSVIVTKLDEATLDIVRLINPKRVLLLSATENNALISSAKVGIGFEYGKDQSIVTYRETLRGIMRILIGLGMTKGRFGRSEVKSEFYNVSDSFEKTEGFILEKGIKNFKLVRKGEVIAKNKKELVLAPKDFYPVLFGNSTYEKIFGFMGERMDID